MMSISIKPSMKDFYLMVSGQIITILGSTLLRFALSLYVLDITGRADIFAGLYAVTSIPFLLAPLGGAITDRFNRRNVMVIFDFINAAIVLSFIVLLFTGSVSILSIGTIMFLLAIISAMYAPLVMASIPQLVPEKKLEQANGIVNGVQALSNIVAPVLGGILYGIIGLKMLVIISCFAFFLSAILEMFITIPFIKRVQESHIIPTIVKDMKEGFIYVLKQPFILKSMLLAALLNLILTPLFVVGAPIIIRVTMESSDMLYGVGMGLIDFATILGALSIGFFTKKLQMKTLYYWMILIALLVIPMALSVTPFILNLGYYPPFILFILSSILIAMIMTIVSIYVITVVQKKTLNENLGKVMAIITAISQCMAPIGQVVYGFMFEEFSMKIYLPILVISFIMLLIAVVTKKILSNEGN
ncbi:MFS transporter [Bacillus cereus group sp. TH160LC]|uniref:MFS transporter n=1 Tax=Bacillus cereus group sp. TH160LC TaxID=3018058 RepID=UPI0022E65F9C|nr:MFS transporter [Bacillus cereus group sp. TH160LC]MDA1652251.1 MFS transporter [Bacillus cereus group sp. TH160LC]